jgi:hypothetical protein
MIGSKTRMVALADLASYPSVAVITPDSCCEAAKALQGRIVLAADAPLLPLDDCADPGSCQCRYRKYPDRRMGDDDRRFPYEGQRATWFTGDERRRSKGQRQDDD